MALVAVFGASGNLGYALVQYMAYRGVKVRAIGRNREKLENLFSSFDTVQVYEADPFDSTQAGRACAGAETVFMCINLPFNDWAPFPELASSILAGTSTAGARLVYPDNVYVYGKTETNSVNEESPHSANTLRGQIRVQVEDFLLNAHRDAVLPVLVARFPDFYGPRVSNTFFEDAITNPAQPLLWPGDPALPHEFIYIDDAAKALATLAEHDNAYGEVWHVPGPGGITGEEWAGIMSEILERKIQVQELPSWLLTAASFFNASSRGFKEIQYLWQTPIFLDGSKFIASFGPYPTRSYKEGIRLWLESFTKL